MPGIPKYCNLQKAEIEITARQSLRVGKTPRIKKANIRTTAKSRKVNPDWFTGKVGMTEISSTIGSRGQNIYHVSFKGGARTKLHSHDGDQILLVTRGRGSLETFSRTSSRSGLFGIKKTQNISLIPGDMVFIPSRTLHTHGSTGKSLFSHIAFNIIRAKGREYKTVWFESDFKNTATSTIR